MGETKNEAASEGEKKEKHADVHGKEEKGMEKKKDKKKKDKDAKCQEDNEIEGKEKEKKKKNPEDKNDAGKLKLKLEKIDAKMQALATKRAEILKLLNEVEQNAANPTGGACLPASS